MKKLAIVAALAALGAASQANAAFTSVLIDPDGAGSNYGTISVTSLNWLAGNAVAIGAGGSAGQSFSDWFNDLNGSGLTLETVYQAQLNTFVDNASGSTSPPVALTSGQWTVVARFTEIATANGANSIDLTPTIGRVSIYYNPTLVANDISGLGYTAGTEILRGTIVGGLGGFDNKTQANPVKNPITDLDRFGTNNRPNIFSDRGSGQSTLYIDIGATAGDFTDAAFFKSNITTFNFSTDGIEDANDTGQLVDPFNQANPSKQVYGYTPVYGTTGGLTVNGELAAIDPVTGKFLTNSDFQFQTTNVTSFNAIPEPSTLAIAGLGMTGLMLRRRKSA